MAASSTVVSRRASRIAGRPRTHREIGITLPVDLLADIETDVGPNNVVDYLTATIEDHERRLALGEWLDLMDAIHGPVSAESEEKARRIWEGEAG